METRFYTYAHRKPGVQGPVGAFYIGKGSGRRAWSHANRNAHWRNAVAKYGLEVQILAYWPDEASAFEHERFLIACFRDLGAPLTNKTDGGEGASGAERSQEFRNNLGNRMRGVTPREETRAKMRAAKLGTKRSAEARAKGSASHRGRKQTPEHIANAAAARAGYAHSAETKARLSTAALGNTRWQGRKHSAKTVEKMQVTGKNRTPEHRANLRAAQQARRQREAAARHPT